MEFMESAVAIPQSLHAEKHREYVNKWRELVEAFRAKDLVHGDLRYPNIICDGNKVMLTGSD